MGQKDKEHIWNLVARKLAGESSPQELEELEQLLRSNPELHYPLQTITDLWQQSGQAGQKKAEQAFSRHLDRMSARNIPFDYPAAPVNMGSPEAPAMDPAPLLTEPTTTGQRRITLTRSRAALLIICATLILAVTTGLIYYHSLSAKRPVASATSPGAPALHEVNTPKGSRTSLNLPDGTRVWLNAGSHISYDKSFGTADRAVTLTGEAFFDVVHNPGKPFVIHADRVDIRVLGTRFNVRSYPSDKTTETTLIRGSIEVSIKDRPNEKIILKPNEKLVVANDDSALHRSLPRKATTAKSGELLVSIRQPTYEEHTGNIVETSWVNNQLVFQDEEFNALAKEMERWYGVDIRFTNPELEKCRFTGNFQKETIQQALDALKLTTPFTYTIHQNQITINDK